MKVSAEAARRLFVAHQMLAPARSLEDGLDAVLELLRRLGSIHDGGQCSHPRCSLL